MRDNTRWPEKSATPSFGNKISDENAAGHSNGLATVSVLKISLDLKRPVTKAWKGTATTISHTSFESSAAISANPIFAQLIQSAFCFLH